MKRPKNPFFEFKQFTVRHDRSALKVCTEACILGAYTDVSNIQTALDIGTGTGLLALMLAQRNNSLRIDAVEIDVESYHQAQENIIQSPFAQQIEVHAGAIQQWAPVNNTRYDLIISNPPFFTSHLRSKNETRNRALHTDTLSLEDLAYSVDKLLDPNGRFVILLPAYQTHLFTVQASKFGLYPVLQLHVYQKLNQPVFRLISTFRKVKSALVVEEMTIYDEDNIYSSAFSQLLSAYYIR